MYGMSKAGPLANDDLISHLTNDGNLPCEHTPRLFCHQTRPICFCLVVDNLGVQYIGREHAEHLE
jgi:hypothetical protein